MLQEVAAVLPQRCRGRAVLLLTARPPPRCPLQKSFMPSAAWPQTLGIVEGGPGPDTQHVGNTMPIVTLPSLAWRPKTTGHHPKPCAQCLPARRKPSQGEWEGRKTPSVLEMSTCLPVPLALQCAVASPETLTALSQAVSHLRGPKYKTGLIRSTASSKFLFPPKHGWNFLEMQKGPWETRTQSHNEGWIF